MGRHSELEQFIGITPAQPHLIHTLSVIILFSAVALGREQLCKIHLAQRAEGFFA